MKASLGKLVYEILGILFQLGGIVFLFVIDRKIGMAILLMAIGANLYSRK